MPRMQAAVMILQQVKEFDQQVAPPLGIAEQRLHLDQGLRIDLAALWLFPPAPPSGAGMNTSIVVC